MPSANASGDRARQRRMYRELRELAKQEHIRRQQKIERLLAQYRRRASDTFRHPSR